MSIQEIYQGRKPRKLMDQVRDRMRVKHYSIRTERAYMGWIKRFILFHDKKHLNVHLERVKLIHDHDLYTHAAPGGQGVKSPLDAL